MLFRIVTTASAGGWFYAWFKWFIYKYMQVTVICQVVCITLYK